MNSAKKIMNQKQETESTASAKVPDTKLSGSSGGGSNKKPLILGGLCIILIIVLCVGVAVQQFTPKVLASVGDTDITMNDIIYPVYEVESQYIMYDSIYQQITGTSVWEAPYQGTSSAAGENVTNSEGLKQEMIEREISYELLYQKAVEAGYELTDEDRADVEEQVTKALKGLSFMQKARLNISKSKLTKRFEKRTLADKFQKDKQEELNKEVDEAETIKDISKKDYRQYDVQFYYASTSSTDDNGNSVAVSDKKRKALAKKIKDIAKEAKTASDFTGLSDEDDKDITFTEDESFTEKDGWHYLSDDNLAKLKKLKNNEVSDAFIDDESGFYVVAKMINNNSSKAYDTACDEAITAAQDAKFQEWYDAEQDNYDIFIDYGFLDEIIIGATTTDIVTLEDLEKMQEDASSEVGGSAE